MQLLDLRPAQIQTHPSNPRREVTDLEELVASIKAKGILEPVIVAPHPAGVKVKRGADYVLIAGHRRLAAARQAKAKTVPAVFRSDLVDEASQLEAMLVENLHRADLSPIEEGEGYQALLALNLTQGDIAEKVGRPKRTVSERVRLAKLPDKVRTKVHTHQVSITDGLALAEFDDAPDVQERLQMHLGTYQWAQALKTARDDRRAERDRAKRRRQLVKDKVTVLDGFPEEGIDPTDATAEWIVLEDLPWSMTAWRAVAEHAGVELPADGDDADALGSIEEAEFDAWHQATCPGHAVVDTGERPRSWQYAPAGDYRFAVICTDPQRHRDAGHLEAESMPAGTDGAGGRVDGNPTTAIPDPEEAELAEKFAEAGRRRREFLQSVLRGDCEDAARALITSQIDAECPAGQYKQVESRRVLAELLALDQDTDLDELRAAVEEAKASWSLPQLVVLAAVAEQASREADLDAGSDWRNAYSRTSSGWSSRYLVLLNDVLGYDWSDFEREHLPAWLAPTLDDDGTGES